MKGLFNHRILMNYFIKKIIYSKSRHPDLEYEHERRILPTCVTSTLEVKRLLHKGYEAYLAYMVNKLTLEEALDNVPVVQEFPDVFF